MCLYVLFRQLWHNDPRFIGTIFRVSVLKININNKLGNYHEFFYC